MDNGRYCQVSQLGKGLHFSLYNDSEINNVPLQEKILLQNEQCFLYRKDSLLPPGMDNWQIEKVCAEVILLIIITLWDCIK